MHEQPVVGGQLRQPLPRRRFDATLGDVDVDADTEVAASPAAASSGSSEQVKAACTPTMPRPPVAQEPLVLGQARPCAHPSGAVPVGDAVRAHHPHADLGARVGDDVRLPSIAFGLSWWSTIAVVPHSSASSAPSSGRPAHHLEVEGDVEPPPHLLEDLEEVVGRRGRRRHAPGQRRVEVVVRRRRAPASSARQRRRCQRHSPVSASAAPHRQRGAPRAVEVVQRGRHRAGGRHQADLADALDAVGRVRAAATRRGSRRSAARPWPAGCRGCAASCWSGSRLGVGREVLGQRVAEAHVHGALDLAFAQHAG